MKNYQYWLYGIAVATMLAACDVNDDFDLEGSRDVAETPKIAPVMTLSASDYKAIADNATNQKIAASRSEAEVAALNAIATNKYFIDEAQAETYLPAYIVKQYPTYTENAKVKVACSFLRGASEYMSDFANVSAYTLSSNAYEIVWGNKVKASFLSPNTLKLIPSLLAEEVENPVEGQMLAVNYAYSDVEPSIGGSSAVSEPTWTQLAAPVRALADFNYVNMGVFDLSAYVGETVNIGLRYKSSTTSAATWEVMNFHASALPYQNVSIFAKQEDGTFAKIVKTEGFAGAGEYVIAALGAEGQYYPFGRLDKDTYNYGYMNPAAITVTGNVISAEDAANYVLTLDEAEGGYTIKNAIGKYLYMSGTYDSFNVSDEVQASEDNGYVWSVSNTGSKNADQFYLTNVLKDKTVRLSYNKGVFSYGSYSDSKIEANTYVSSSLVNEEGGFTIYDVNLGSLPYVWSNTKYGWKASAFVNNTNNATESILVSPVIDIAEDAIYPCFTIDEAYKYTSTIDDDLTVWISTDFAAASQRAVTTRSASGVNKTTLYIYSDGEWTEYTNSEILVSVWQPSDYDELGTNYIQKPNAVLPTYLAARYPYAVGGEQAVVVYNAGNAYAAAEYQFKNGAWSAVGEKVAKTLSFAKKSGVWTLQSNEFYSNDLLGDEGGFTVTVVKMDDALSYIWQNDGTYGWKASGYKSGNKNAEAWLVSPVIDLTEASAPYLTFDEAVNYLNGNDLNAYCSVAVTEEYDGADATASAWEFVDIPKRPTGDNWTFVNVGEVNLSAFAGKKIYIGFRYISDTGVATTWEFKNMLVTE